jgi:hypothetical protein
MQSGRFKVADPVPAARDQFTSMRWRWSSQSFSRRQGDHLRCRVVTRGRRAMDRTKLSIANPCRARLCSTKSEAARRTSWIRTSRTRYLSS